MIEFNLNIKYGFCCMDVCICISPGKAPKVSRPPTLLRSFPPFLSLLISLRAGLHQNKVRVSELHDQAERYHARSIALDRARTASCPGGRTKYGDLCAVRLHRART